MDETVSKSFEGVVERLRGDGRFDVKDSKAEGNYARYSRARAVITVRESSWFYEAILRTPKLRRRMHQDVLKLMDGGLRTGMIEYMRSTGLRAESLREVPRLLEGIDALIMPTCLIAAPRIDEVLGSETGRIRFLLLRNTEFFNMTGLPALSIPINKAGQSMPTALQVVARHGQDGLVLSIAEKIWAAVHPG